MWETPAQEASVPAGKYCRRCQAPVRLIKKIFFFQKLTLSLSLNFFLIFIFILLYFGFGLFVVLSLCGEKERERESRGGEEAEERSAPK